MSIILLREVWTPLTTPLSSSFGDSSRNWVTVKSADHNPDKEKRCSHDTDQVLSRTLANITNGSEEMKVAHFCVWGLNEKVPAWATYQLWKLQFRT